MTYDIEIFCDDLANFLKANLNIKIQEINSLKNDGLNLAEINDEAYFFQTMDETVSNFDPFIYYGVQDIESQGLGPATRKKYTVVAAVIMADLAEDTKLGKRLLRYSRVLEEVISEKYSDIASDAFKVKLNSLVPISLRLSDTSENFRAVGIELEIVIF